MVETKSIVNKVALASVLFVSLFVCFIDVSAGEFPALENVRYTDPSKKQRLGTVEFTGCQLSDPASSIYRDAECAIVRVPENYGLPKGRSIDIFVARIKSGAKTGKDDPMLLIAGGPGQGASESFLSPWMGFQKILKQRDLYLIDQRGTGKSHPLDCPAQSSERELDDAEKTQWLKNCRANLDADLDQYTTSIAIRDFEQVRHQLGIAQWNIYGISYGTRVAQHYLRRFPASVRTVMLDGVVAPDHALGAEVAQQSQGALAQLTARCESDEQCNKSFPELAENINGLLQKLKSDPENLTFEKFSTGEVTSFQFTHLHLAGLLRMALYSPEMSALLPVMLHAAYQNNNFLPLARLAQSENVDLAKSLSVAMHNTVVCTEDVPFFTEALLADSRGAAAKSYLGASFLDDLLLLCAHWPKGLIDPDFKQLVATDTPVLLMSGSADPITPPSYAEAAAEQMRNKRHIVVEGFGHGVARVGCMPTIMARFVDQASVDLDASCLQKQKASPIFIDFNGPAP